MQPRPPGTCPGALCRITGAQRPPCSVPALRWHVAPAACSPRGQHSKVTFPSATLPVGCWLLNWALASLHFPRRSHAEVFNPLHRCARPASSKAGVVMRKWGRTLRLSGPNSFESGFFVVKLHPLGQKPLSPGPVTKPGTPVPEPLPPPPAVPLWARSSLCGLGRPERAERALGWLSGSPCSPQPVSCPVWVPWNSGPVPPCVSVSVTQMPALLPRQPGRCRADPPRTPKGRCWARVRHPGEPSTRPGWQGATLIWARAHHRPAPSPAQASEKHQSSRSLAAGPHAALVWGLLPFLWYRPYTPSPSLHRLLPPALLPC